jgi:phenylacetate-CoA ligase
MYSRSDMARLAYNEHRALATSGITRDDIVLLTCTLDRCFIAGLAYYQGVRSIGAAGVRNGLNTIESHAEIFKELRPSVVIGVPSFLRHLGQGLRDRNIDMSCIKRLVCIGEPVRDRRMNITGLCNQVENVWGTKIHSTYASSEIITSFCECEAHNGGHLIPELVVAEIIDDKGNILPDGECGELVLTALQTTGMPLIRFRTGDITFKISEPCSCGRQTPRIGPILGRKAQMLKCKGTTLFPQVVFSALDTAEDVLDYYVVVTGEDLSDHLDVYVALKNPGGDLDGIRSKLQAVCRMNVPVYEKTAEEVRTQVFSRSRKPIRFVDLRKKMEL